MIMRRPALEFPTIASYFFDRPTPKFETISGTMTEQTSELTTRNVFLQVDQRLTRLEDDLREAWTGLKTEIRDVRRDVGDLRKKITSRFQWTIGLSLTTWVTLMLTLLLKL